MSIDLTASLEKSVAQNDAAEIMKQIGVVIAKAPELTDEQVTDMMEQVLTEYLVQLRRVPCGNCGK